MRTPAAERNPTRRRSPPTPSARPRSKPVTSPQARKTPHDRNGARRPPLGRSVRIPEGEQARQQGEAEGGGVAQPAGAGDRFGRQGPTGLVAPVEIALFGQVSEQPDPQVAVLRPDPLERLLEEPQELARAVARSSRASRGAGRRRSRARRGPATRGPRTAGPARRRRGSARGPSPRRPHASSCRPSRAAAGPGSRGGRHCLSMASRARRHNVAAPSYGQGVDGAGGRHERPGDGPVDIGARRHAGAVVLRHLTGGRRRGVERLRHGPVDERPAMVALLAAQGLAHDLVDEPVGADRPVLGHDAPGPGRRRARRAGVAAQRRSPR